MTGWGVQGCLWVEGGEGVSPQAVGGLKSPEPLQRGSGSRPSPSLRLPNREGGWNRALKTLFLSSSIFF